MILTKLYEYADQRMTLPPAMYGLNKVAWLISLTETGKYEGWVSLKSKKFKRGQPTLTPHIGRTVAVKPKLLADTGEYVLGIGRPTSKPERVQECHSQFKDLVKACADATEVASVKNILNFLTSSEIELAKNDLPTDFDPGDVVTFRVGSIVPANADEKLDSIQKFWANHTSGDSGNGSNEPIMTCLITGKETAVEQRLPFLVKGLIGGQPSGTALVSANSSPFMSYGLKNSLTSPISREAAESFTKALNALIADERSHIPVGSTTYVFWTREETQDDFINFLDKPKAEEVKALLESSRTARQASGLTDEKINQFYALSLTANNARAVVRDWLETTVPNVRANLQQWFQAQQMVDLYGASPRPLGVYTLAASVYRDAAKEMQPTAPTALIRNALHGDRIPEDMLVKLVRRNRAEQEISYPRAVLLKLIFSSNPNRREMMQNMEKLNPDPNLQGLDLEAYACGRLLAVLDSIQKAALGSVNATLTDRYYGSASSTPAVAFPPLLRGARAHLSKLRKTKTGAYKALEERLEEVMVILPTFPKTLGLQQQGLFGLGYYHQRASDRAAAKAKSEANKAEKTTAAS